MERTNWNVRDEQTSHHSYLYTFHYLLRFSLFSSAVIFVFAHIEFQVREILMSTNDERYEFDVKTVKIRENQDIYFANLSHQRILEQLKYVKINNSA